MDGPPKHVQCGPDREVESNHQHDECDDVVDFHVLSRVDVALLKDRICSAPTAAR